MKRWSSIYKLHVTAAHGLLSRRGPRKHRTRTTSARFLIFSACRPLCSQLSAPAVLFCFGISQGTAPSLQPSSDSRRKKEKKTAGGRTAGVLRLAPLVEQLVGQTLQGSFSAVSKPNFARKYTFESSRRDLQNALLCTALLSQFLSKICHFFQNSAKL